jgi:hypothetical protein
MLLALVVFLATTFLSPAWVVQSAPDKVKFTVHAGESIVATVGGVNVEVSATEDTIVYLSLEGGSVYSVLEPHPDAPEAPYVVITVLPQDVVFRGVVLERILAYFYMTETGHTEL